MSKRVKLSIEVDSHFIRLLQANVQLSGLLKEDRDAQMTPMQVLGVAILGEARGALEEQVDAKIPHEWRPHFEVIHSERKVTEIED